MPESVLTLLKFCLVAVLYLFFFRVLRAVWAELRQPEPPAAGPAPMPAAVPAHQPARAAAAPAPRAPSAPSRLAARPGRLEVLRPPALAGASFELGDVEVTVGRAPGCSVLLDDPTVSSRHARLSPQGGRLVVEDVGSRNGTLVNGRRVKGATEVSVGDRLSIGPNVELEVLP